VRVAKEQSLENSALEPTKALTIKLTLDSPPKQKKKKGKFKDDINIRLANGEPVRIQKRKNSLVEDILVILCEMT
jgi:hypothetical protein